MDFKDPLPLPMTTRDRIPRSRATSLARSQSSRASSRSTRAGDSRTGSANASRNSSRAASPSRMSQTQSTGAGQAIGAENLGERVPSMTMNWTPRIAGTPGQGSSSDVPVSQGGYGDFGSWEQLPQMEQGGPSCSSDAKGKKRARDESLEGDSGSSTQRLRTDATHQTTPTHSIDTFTEYIQGHPFENYETSPAMLSFTSQDEPPDSQSYQPQSHEPYVPSVPPFISFTQDDIEFAHGSSFPPRSERPQPSRHRPEYTTNSMLMFEHPVEEDSNQDISQLALGQGYDQDWAGWRAPSGDDQGPGPSRSGGSGSGEGGSGDAAGIAQGIGLDENGYTANPTSLTDWVEAQEAMSASGIGMAEHAPAGGSSSAVQPGADVLEAIDSASDATSSSSPPKAKDKGKAKAPSSSKSKSKGKGKQPRSLTPEIPVFEAAPEPTVQPTRPRQPQPPSSPPADPLSSYTCPICFFPPTNATLTPCGHICCGECLFTAVKTTMARNAPYGVGAGAGPVLGWHHMYGGGGGRGSGGLGRGGGAAGGSAAAAGGQALCPVCREEIKGWDGRGGGVIGLKIKSVVSI